MNWSSFFTIKMNQILDYARLTTANLLKQILAIPSLGQSIILHPETNRLMHKVLQIALFDLLPVILVKMVNTNIQQKIDEEQNNTNFNPLLLFALSYGSEALCWILVTRRFLRFQIHTLVLSLEAPHMINATPVNRSLDEQCIQQKCSILRFLQGSGRDLVEFYATECTILGMSYLPWWGPELASGLSIYHRGRYIATILLPELCNRHQMIYLSTHSELALSLGIGLFFTNWLTVYIMHHLTGLPSSFYEKTITQLVFFVYLSLARQLNLPKSSVERHQIRDPLSFFQEKVIGNIFDLICLGLKVKLQRKLNQGSSLSLITDLCNLPLADYQSSVSQLLQHPLIKWTLLPSLLHSYDNWSNDFILIDCWSSLLKQSISILEQIENTANKPIVKLSLSVVGVMPPQFTASVISFFGLPPDLIQVVMMLISHPQILAHIKQLKTHLIQFDVSPKHPQLLSDYVLITNPNQIDNSVQKSANQNPLVSRISITKRLAPSINEDAEKKFNPFYN